MELTNFSLAWISVVANNSQPLKQLKTPGHNRNVMTASLRHHMALGTGHYLSPGGGRGGGGGSEDFGGIT